MKSKKVFGEIEGYPISSAFTNRRTLSQSGVHTPSMQGISGNKRDGANSIVVNGGYVDDEDHGREIIYTGAGGNDPRTKRQIADQSLEQSGNAGLVTSQLQGLPVRVVRGSEGNPAHSPTAGFRYDGLFRVSDHWSQIGRDGFRIWRFRLEQITGLDAESWAALLPSGNKDPKTKHSMVTRVVRSTDVANEIKKLYGDSCQVCGTTLEIPGRTTSEGAHIRGLGRPHLGPDTPDNVLCLCPNHHTLFDSGGIYVSDSLEIRSMTHELLGRLRVVKGHEINLEHFRYHREIFGYEDPRDDVSQGGIESKSTSGSRNEGSQTT